MRKIAQLLAFVLLSTSPIKTVAEESKNVTEQTPTNDAAITAPKCAPVSLAGIEVICLLQGVGSISKLDRAKFLNERLASLSADLTLSSQSFAAKKVSDSDYVISNGSVDVINLREGDSADLSSKSFEDVADEVAERVRAAIDADRVIRSPNAIMLGIAKSLAVSLALLSLLFVYSWAYKKLHALVDRSQGRFIKSIRIQTFEILNAGRITALVHWLLSASRVIATLIALYIFVPLVLSFFPWTANWSQKLFGYIVTPFITFIHVITDYIPNLFFIAAIMVCTRYFLKAIKFFFTEIGRGNLQFNGFYREWADPTYKLVRIIIVAFAFVMAFPYLPGSHSPAFQGVSVFLGLLLSFGSSSAIANIVAGVVLTYMRPFKIGDRVKIADTVGNVLEKNLLVTRIKTIKHVEVTIPNSMVLGSHIVNYSSAASDEGLILNTKVTIGYDVPWRQVHELLISAAQQTELIDLSKKTFVLQTALNDFYVEYEINAYTSHPNQMAKIYSDLHANIQDRFNEAKVEIMSPHYSALRDGAASTIPTGM